MPSMSHVQIGQVIAEKLVERGHNVTMITPYQLRKDIGQNYHEILLETLDEKLLGKTYERYKIEKSFLIEVGAPTTQRFEWPSHT